MSELRPHPEPGPVRDAVRDHAQPPPSEFGLEWSDVCAIRDRLRLTPTERLRMAQETWNAAVRIRAQNEHSG